MLFQFSEVTSLRLLGNLKDIVFSPHNFVLILAGCKLFLFSWGSPANQWCNVGAKIVKSFPVNKRVPSFRIKLIKLQQLHITMGKEFFISHL